MHVCGKNKVVENILKKYSQTIKLKKKKKKERKEGRKWRKESGNNRGCYIYQIYKSWRIWLVRHKSLVCWDPIFVDSNFILD